MSLLILFDRRFGPAVGGTRDAGGIKKHATLNVQYYKKAKKEEPEEIVELPECTIKLPTEPLKKAKVSPRIIELLAEEYILKDEVDPLVQSISQAIALIEQQIDLENRLLYLERLRAQQMALRAFLMEQEKKRIAALDEDLELVLMILH